MPSMIQNWYLTVSDFKDIAQAFASISTVVAALAALYWFFFTGSFRRRVQFDVDLQIIDGGHPNFYAAEVMLIVDNKGQREHRMHNLYCEVRQSELLASEGAALETHLELKNWVPEGFEYYFVAAGVKQTLTRSFRIPKAQKDQLVRVRALFAYNQKALPVSSLDDEGLKTLDDAGAVVHTLSRLFKVEPRSFSAK